MLNVIGGNPVFCTLNRNIKNCTNRTEPRSGTNRDLTATASRSSTTRGCQKSQPVNRYESIGLCRQRQCDLISLLVRVIHSFDCRHLPICVFVGIEIFRIVSIRYRENIFRSIICFLWFFEQKERVMSSYRAWQHHLLTHTHFLKHSHMQWSQSLFILYTAYTLHAFHYNRNRSLPAFSKHLN